MTRREHNNLKIDGRDLAFETCRDSRVGIDDNGTIFSKDPGEEVARAQGVTYISPEGFPFYPGFTRQMPTKTRDWHKNEGRAPRRLVTV
jgi:hypothetical protein